MAPKAGGGGAGTSAAASRAAMRTKWLCRFCCDGKGKPYVNYAHQLKCNSCSLAKGVAFMGKVVDGPPSRSIASVTTAPWQKAQHDKELDTMRKQMAELKRKLAAAESSGTAAGASAAAGGGNAGTSVSVDASAARKARIAELNVKIGKLTGDKEPDLVAALGKFKQEKERLLLEDLHDKPVATQVQLWHGKISKAELAINKTNDALAAKLEAAQRIQDEAKVLEERLVAQKAELVQLQQQQSELLKGLPAPPGGEKERGPVLGDIIPGLGVSAEALEQHLTGLGASGELRGHASQLVAALQAAAAAAARQADDTAAAAAGKTAAAMPPPSSAMPPAAEQRQAEATAVDMEEDDDLEDIKACLLAAGHTVPGSEEEIRAAAKRLADAHIAWQAAKRQRLALAANASSGA